MSTARLRLSSANILESRKDSPYHSAGNGFAERNIRRVREILRSALSEKNLHRTKRHKLLPSLVFALNYSSSRATKCIHYTVVFSREPILPVDVLIGHCTVIKDVVSPSDYVKLGITLKNVWDTVLRHLNISKLDMLSQYHQNLRFHNHSPAYGSIRSLLKVTRITWPPTIRVMHCAGKATKQHELPNLQRPIM